MSENGVTADLNAALAKAQSEFGAIPRSRTVSAGSYSYSYAPLDTILDTVRPTLAANGLALVQLLENAGLRTELRHSSGGVVGANFPLPTIPAKPQELGSLLSYLRRYAVLAILGLATEEDDDGQTAQRGAEKEPDTLSDPQRKKIYALFGDLDTLKVPVPAPFATWKTWGEARTAQEYGGKKIGALTKAEASDTIERLTYYVKRKSESPQEPVFVAPDVEPEYAPFEDESVPF